MIRNGWEFALRNFDTFPFIAGLCFSQGLVQLVMPKAGVSWRTVPYTLPIYCFGVIALIPALILDGFMRSLIVCLASAVASAIYMCILIWGLRKFRPPET